MVNIQYGDDREGLRKDFGLKSWLSKKRECVNARTREFNGKKELIRGSNLASGFGVPGGTAPRIRR